MPKGWIRKESKTRPNNFYYFNTKTGKTQWQSPVDDVKVTQPRFVDVKTSKFDANSKGRSSVQSRLKISDKSKDGELVFVVNICVANATNLIFKTFSEKLVFH